MATCDELVSQLNGLQNQLADLQYQKRHPNEACADQGLTGTECQLYLKGLGNQITAVQTQIAGVQQQQAAQGCLASMQRTLGGLAILWTDNSALPGPKPSGFSASLTIINSTGEVTLVFADLKFGNVVVHQNGSSAGHYDFSSGALNLHVPISVENVPFVGTITTDSFLSTDISITTPSSGTFAGARVGSPADATGSITLVGTAPIKALGGLVNNTAFLRIVGTLSK